MYLSCNQIKKYIEDGDKIDFLQVFKEFTIHSAEVDSIEIKGEDIQNVVVAEVKSLKNHSENSKYTVATLNIFKKEITVVTSANNLKQGMKVPCALVNGKIKGIDCIKETSIAGIISEGVLVSEKELGISDNHTEIMELDSSYKVGKDIKELLPIDDIIIEIDNKSLTNRPDMWGYYGIAREVAAITGKKLLPLKTEKIINDKTENIKINIIDKENCNRYSALKISNITKKQININTRILLYYSGMRSISLLVDLTNFLMLEMGQPMHAFDADNVRDIVVKNTGNEPFSFVTLDGIKRKIPKNTLMIYNEKEAVAIAGIMGGLSSEIKPDTTSILLESANFDGTNVRHSSTLLGLRTEAVARYEKKLDPNMTINAIERFVKLLKDEDNQIIISSNLADVYTNELKPNKIILKKDTLKKYIGFSLEESKVKEILNSLEFDVKINNDDYEIIAPTFRSTKDISCAVDIIEEITRIYGYNKLQPEPLKLDLVIKHSDGLYEFEYNLKKDVCIKAKANEVHTYLWYDLEVLSQIGIDKNDNIKIANKKDNNILRDDLSLSLLKLCFENAKHMQEFTIFEIGSQMKEKEERHLSIMKVSLDNKIKESFMELKQLVYDIVKEHKNKNVVFEASKNTKEYLDEDYTLNIIVDKQIIGYISLVKKEVSINCSKKTSIVNVDIDVEKLLNITAEAITDVEISKYPTTILDYTIITDKDTKYEKIESMLLQLKNKYIKKHYLTDIYIDEVKKTTIRFEIASSDKTLNREEINQVQDYIEKHIEQNGLKVVGK